MTTMAPVADQPEAWVPRVLDVAGLLARRSHFLLGPRLTGKTSLVRNRLKNAKLYDLLDSSVYLALSQNPGRLAAYSADRDRWFRGS